MASSGASHVAHLASFSGANVMQPGKKAHMCRDPFATAISDASDRELIELIELMQLMTPVD